MTISEYIKVLINTPNIVVNRWSLEEYSFVYVTPASGDVVFELIVQSSKVYDSFDNYIGEYEDFDWDFINEHVREQ